MKTKLLAGSFTLVIAVILTSMILLALYSTIGFLIMLGVLGSSYVLVVTYVLAFAYFNGE